MDGLRVLVVAEDPLARAGLAAVLRGQPGCTVVGQVAATADLGGQLAIYRPDAIVWDLGWDAGQVIGPDGDRPGDLPEVEVPVVALLPDERSAAGTWLAGARGMVLRDIAADALVAALQAAAAGLVVLDPALAGAIPLVQAQQDGVLVEELTPRELEVLQLLAEGLSNRAIGVRLAISEHTVKFHVNAILGKLGAQSRTDAVVRATRLGLIIL
jgi:two-component system nitrate/nitrite response regulator NarL